MVLRTLLIACLGILRDVAPIVLVVGVFQFLVLRQPLAHPVETATGLVLMVAGLFLFTQGLHYGLFPLGESLAFQFARRGNVWWLLLFAFSLGFGTAIAEPALLAVTAKAESVSQGHLDATALRVVTGLGVGAALAGGVLRIILGHPAHFPILGGFVLIALLMPFAPPEIIGLAYDSGAATTTTVTVPLVAALGVGLSSSIKGRNPLLDGFGLIAFAATVPIIGVILYGIWVY